MATAYTDAVNASTDAVNAGTDASTIPMLLLICFACVALFFGIMVALFCYFFNRCQQGTLSLDRKNITAAAGPQIAPEFVWDRSVYKDNDANQQQQDCECVICLSEMADGDLARRLPRCGHFFHVTCIDLWLPGHWTCPVCRTPAIAVASAPPAQAETSESPAAVPSFVAIHISGFLKDYSWADVI